MKRTIRIFIGSSSENRPVVKALCDLLGSARKKTFKIDPAPWDQGTFKLSSTYIEALEEEMEKADFSILVMTPNDVTSIRGEEVLTPRDNVLFELGLFMGRLNRKRCFMLFETDDKPKLPTDLLGVKAATYQKSDHTGLQKTLVPACQEILNLVSDILEDQKLSSFVARIEGEWWERIQTKAGVEFSFFRILPDDKYRSLHLEGDHYNGEGVPIGDWKSVVVGIREAQRQLNYIWKGEHPPTPEGDAAKVQGFGTLEFNPATGPFEDGKGGFIDVDPNTTSADQWKRVRLKRVTNKSHIRTMIKGGLKKKKIIVCQVHDNW